MKVWILSMIVAAMPTLNVLAMNLCGVVVAADPNLSSKTVRVLDLLDELSSIRSPSKNEAAMRNQLIKDARSKGYAYQVDDVGNLVVTVPATGKFKGSVVPSLALQTHMDMEEVVEGGSVDEEFNKPLSFATSQEEGRLVVHSKGKTRNVGFDPRTSLAVMRRLILDSNVVHPEL